MSLVLNGSRFDGFGAAAGIQQTIATVAGLTCEPASYFAGNPESGGGIKTMTVSAEGDVLVFAGKMKE